MSDTDAAAAAASSSYELLRGLITCPICAQIFVDPVLNTACGHVFCDECVNAVVEGGSSPRVKLTDSGKKAPRKATLACPTCKAPCFRWTLQRATPIGNILDVWAALRRADANSIAR